MYLFNTGWIEVAISENEFSHNFFDFPISCPVRRSVPKGPTFLINDTNFDQWMVAWLQQRTSTRTKSQMKKSLVYGISSSGKSTDVNKALQWASDNGMETCLITAKPIAAAATS